MASTKTGSLASRQQPGPDGAASTSWNDQQCCFLHFSCYSPWVPRLSHPGYLQLASHSSFSTQLWKYFLLLWTRDPFPSGFWTFPQFPEAIWNCKRMFHLPHWIQQKWLLGVIECEVELLLKMLMWLQEPGPLLRLQLSWGGIVQSGGRQSDDFVLQGAFGRL